MSADRNTTLPHPDADLSPNATISQDDLELTNSLKRTRRSFLAKHKRTISHGYISPQMEAAYGTNAGLLLHHNRTNSSGALAEEAEVEEGGEKPSTRGTAFGSAAAPSVSTDGRPSKDGTESLSSAGDAASERRKHRSVLRRLGLRK